MIKKVRKRAPKRTYIIELSYKEAILLKSMVQNALDEDESEESSALREKIWNLLDIPTKSPKVKLHVEENDGCF